MRYYVKSEMKRYSLAISAKALIRIEDSTTLILYRPQGAWPLFNVIRSGADSTIP